MPGGNKLQLKIGRHLKITRTEEAINEISAEVIKKGSPWEGISKKPIRDQQYRESIAISKGVNDIRNQQKRDSMKCHQKRESRKNHHQRKSIRDQQRRKSIRDQHRME